MAYICAVVLVEDLAMNSTYRLVSSCAHNAWVAVPAGSGSIAQSGATIAGCK